MRSRSFSFHLGRWAALLAIVMGATVFAAAADKSTDKFAQCLTDKKATMYGDFRCPHCKEQKEMFGKSFKKVNYVECGIKGQPPNVQTQVCRDLQIKYYPTWTFADGDRLVGPQSLQKLGQKTGCSLP
jgi:ribosomal protein S27E